MLMWPHVGKEGRSVEFQKKKRIFEWRTVLDSYSAGVLNTVFPFFGSEFPIQGGEGARCNKQQMIVH